MARQVLPIVGAVVGAYFGNPQLGYAVGSIIGNAVDPQVIQGPKIGEAGIQTASEGGPMAIVMGTGPVVGNIICRGNKQIKKKKERSGKGGPVTESERVYWTFAIGIGEPIDAITRIWMDEKLVYDIRPESTIVAESAEFAQKFTFYDGSETQEADPDLEAFIGVGNVPAYHGTAYIVFPNFDLTDTGQRIPTFRFECASSATSASPPAIYAATQTTENNGIVAVSADGDTFLTTEDTGLGAEITDIHACGGAVFVFDANGNGRVKLVGTGTWHPTTGTATGSGRVNDMAFTSGVWALVYQSGDTIGRSTDAVNFSGVSVPARSRYSIAGKGGAFVAGGSNGNITVSQDAGLSWAEFRVNPLNTLLVASVIATESGFLVAQDRQWPLSFSPSGEEGDWETRPHPYSSGSGGTIVLGHLDGVTVLKNTDGNTAWSDDSFDTYTEGGQTVGYNGQPKVYSNSLGFFTGSGATDGASVGRSANGSTWAESTYEASQVSIAATDTAEIPISEGQPVSLASIVTMLHGRVNQPAAKFNVTALTDEVDGVVFAGDYTVASAIRSVIAPYFADASEYDGGSGWKINYVKRGAAVVKTLTEDDLVDEPENSVRESAIEYPKALDMFFQSPTVGYAPAKASPQRSSPDIRVVGRVQAQVPVTFADEGDAWAISDKMLKVAWADAEGEVKFTVTDEHLDLVPSDCVGLSLRGTVRRLRITKIEDNPGTRTLTCRVDRQSAYTSKLTGIPLPIPTPPPPSIVGQAIGVTLDIPALTDNDDVLGYYDGMAGQTDAWYGGEMQRQNGVGDFDTVNSFSSGTVIGVLLDDVTDASEHYTDTTNILHVQFYTDQEIDSLTSAQFLSEGGALAVEWSDSEGTHWEIMQYRDAEEVDAGEYKLTTLHRGRLNSGTAAHTAGDKVVFLEGVKRVSAVTAMLDTDLTHRAVSYSTSPENALEITQAYTGLMQTEWPVAQLTGDIDGNDLDLSCIPRHRFGTDDNPVQSINHDGYRWTATDGTNSLTADTAGTTHTFDVTGWSTPITATVAQLNRYTGAGPAVSEEIE